MIEFPQIFQRPDAEPMFREIDLPGSPIDLARALQHEDHFVFLDSSENRGDQGRFSILAWEPRLVFQSKEDRVLLRVEGREVQMLDHPLDVLDRIFRSCSASSPKSNLPCFAGGAIGYFGYDLFPWIEHYDHLSAVDDLNLPDCCLGFYESALVFDHRNEQWWIAGTPVFGEEKTFQERLAGTAKQARSCLSKSGSSRAPGPHGVTQADSMLPASNFTKAEYLKAVRKAIEYIYAGDIYQINLSQRFHSRLTAPPFDLFQVLRTINPSYYGAYLAYDGHAVISSSPELFLRRRGAEVETRPIKGTRPRGTTPEEDERYMAELQESPKDAAELSMIVDLERNDLGRVCTYGSVVVDEHRYIERLPTVFHTISTVRGELREEVGVVDLLRATFPGGSITGCPKIRSIEIIDELEPTRRNAYTGSVGYVGFTGDLELNIAIRTLIVKGQDVYYQVGGGIVADSDPEAEYVETLDKAAAMVQALNAVVAAQDREAR